jgi:hypothetical protein
VKAAQVSGDHATSAGRRREDFVLGTGGLDLPKPKLIDVAVPANRRLGLSHEA